MKYLVNEMKLSIRKACGLAELQTSTFYYKARRGSDDEIIKVITNLANRYKRWGYRRITDRMNYDGIVVNYKKIYRLYSEKGLQVRKRKRKKTIIRSKMKPEVPTKPNQRWSMDFMSDSTEFSGKFRIFNVIDDFVRDCLISEVARSIPGKRVTEYLDRAIEIYGKPESLLSDNGAEFTGNDLEKWCEKHGIEHFFIEPGKPQQNAFVESFNGSMRDECLNSNWFSNLDDAREIVESYRTEYNYERPHRSIGRIPPGKYRELLLSGAPHGGHM